MDAVEAKRNFDKVAQEDGKRERAPARGVEVPDNPTARADLDGKRERAPANGGDGIGYSRAVFGFEPWGR